MGQSSSRQQYNDIPSGSPEVMKADDGHSKVTIALKSSTSSTSSFLSSSSNGSSSQHGLRSVDSVPLRKGSDFQADSSDSHMRSRSSSKETPTTGKDFRTRLSHRRKVSEFEEEYTKSRELGEGITGKVYLVRTKRGEQKAMKTINLARVNRAQLKELRTEVALLKLLDHPNIVRLIEVFEDSHNVMLVMDHCRGGSLASASGRQRLRTEREVASIVFQLFTAIKYVHEHKIVHRDIKLENVLFVSEDRQSLHVQLIDFGLSGIQHKSPMWLLRGKKKRLFATTCGTTFYMAPEVIEGKYDEQCDNWSLGVLTYLLLTGKPPFLGSDEQSTLYKILKSEPDFTAPIWSKLNPQAQVLVRNLLMKDPSKRWTAAKALESPWFDKYRMELDKSASGAELEGDVMSSLSKFSNYGKMKKMALLVIAHHFSDLKDLTRLKNMFLALDKDSSGSITYGELKALFEKNHVSDELASKLFSGVDVDDSGELQLTEFLAATMEAVCTIDRDRMADAFDRIAQGQEFITTAHLETLLGKIDRKQLKEMISSLDDNNDGKLSREEFLSLVDREQEHELDKLIEEDGTFQDARV